ncbi:hypothetical protein DYB30_004129 [Aphanomyces astaci]|uniref:Uncharacterized protein n=1 Tax=Aphanomyces astaci TaxID=112090 RepID=A0A397B2Q3_APHAT|nr:hypothetical protein DYB36_009789 [Aphanomyces astaci]RHY49640.1 hypothetical protein DYB34_009321 [Aphanomyces astaci]RHY53433.1 hypothetical protein DYB38_005509 [Aphanomyces astaci]RHY78958.1 hypothetical protein DYB30_004129 [Aphanomyces astaci]
MATTTPPSPVNLLKPSSWMNLSPPPTHKCVQQFLIVNVVLPIAIYYAASMVVSDMPALAFSAIPPAVEALQQLVAYRLLDPISCTVVVSVVLAVGLMYWTNEPKVLLLQHSILTVSFGIALLVSIHWDENIFWRYYREFCGTTDDKRVMLMAQWRDPNVKALTKTVSWVWGVGMLVEAVVRVGFVVLLPIKVMVILSPCLAFVFTIAVCSWTVWFAKTHGFHMVTNDKEITVTTANPSHTIYQTI